MYVTRSKMFLFTSCDTFLAWDSKDEVNKYQTFYSIYSKILWLWNLCLFSTLVQYVFACNGNSVNFLFRTAQSRTCNFFAFVQYCKKRQLKTASPRVKKKQENETKTLCQQSQPQCTHMYRCMSVKYTCTYIYT